MMQLRAATLGLLFWAAMPALFAVLLALLQLVPKRIDGLGQFMPLLSMAPVFFWAIHHPRHMPYWFVFLLGLCMDALAGPLLGLSALVGVVFLALAKAQYKYIHKEGFTLQWAYFALLLAAAGALQWLMLALFGGVPLGAGNAFMQWLLTVACYPLLHRLCDVLYRFIGQRRNLLLHGR
jgi:rod shape-determining protein MreD